VLTILGVVAVAALILANGYFVAARRGRLEAEAASNGRSARAVQVHRRLSFMLSGAQLGITVTSLVVGFVAEPTLGRALEPLMGAVGVPGGAQFGVAVTVGFVLATIAQMVVGELAPKNLAIARPEPVARALAPSTWAFMRGASPAHPVLRRLGQPAAPGRGHHTGRGAPWGCVRRGAGPDRG
jgi:CBS domain containing-hemolysin-like protein